MDDPTIPTMTTIEVAELLRVTPRQLDYWAHEGLLPVPRSLGSGVTRRWTADEVRCARAFAALVHAGVDIRAAGEAMSRALVSDELFVAQLGLLVVTGPLP